MDGATSEGFAIREYVSLAPYTTLGIGGPARWFATVAADAEVEAAARFARQRGLPLFVMGGGSNLLVSDAGFDGLVLHIALSGIAIADGVSDAKRLVTAAAGENWEAFVQFGVDRDMQGVECLAGIPGTVGGTPVQNVGAYGQDVSQTIEAVRAYDMHAEAFVVLPARDLDFGYRTSVLNSTERGRYIVTAVTFALTPNGRPHLSYADLRRIYQDGPDPSLAEVAETVRAIRRSKGMVIDKGDPDSRSAGSFFRNPVIGHDELERTARDAGLPVSELPQWPAGDDRVKVPAAWLVERAGFRRGFVLGQAGISSKHTLALINRGGATERDIALLRDRIVMTVEERFGIRLEQEPVNVG